MNVMRENKGSKILRIIDLFFYLFHAHLRLRYPVKSHRVLYEEFNSKG